MSHELCTHEHKTVKNIGIGVYKLYRFWGKKGPNCHLKGLLSDWSQGMKVLLKKKWIFVIKGIILSWFSEAFDWKQGPIWSRQCGSDALKRIIIRLKSGDRSDSEK